jgi:predicted nucleotidyltransferase
MKDNKEILIEILSVLNKENLLDKVIIIGSWAVYFYQFIYQDFEVNVRTTDIDFYVPSPTNFKEKSGLIKAFQNINYDIRTDTLTKKVVFFSPDEFELEFITGLTRQNFPTVRLGNTSIYAESLPHLNLFNHYQLKYEFEGMQVTLASPPTYLIQKLLIIHKRKNKTTKDVESLLNVLNYIITHPDLLAELNIIIRGLSKAAKKTILENSTNFKIMQIRQFI